MQPDEDLQIFRYLQTKRVLIVDQNAAARATEMDILKDLGARRTHIEQVADSPSAEARIREVKPEVIICEYKVGNAPGLELVHLRNREAAGTHGLLTVLVSRNARPAAIAEAVEAGVDCYVLKPFTSESFRKHVRAAILTKIAGGPYLETLDQGNARLEAGNLEEAEAAFRIALRLSPQPSMAHYYLGRLSWKREDRDGAKRHFQAGLDLSPRHFFCLLGLFDLHFAQGEKREAYATVKRILERYPLSPGRIEEVLGLCLEIQSFEDLDLLYALYLDLGERSELLTQRMVSALVAGGWQAAGAKDVAKAMGWFQKAVVSSGRTFPVLREVIHSLLAFGLCNEAEKMLAEAQQDKRTDPEFRSLSFEIADKAEKPEAVFEQGLRLLREEVFHPEIYRILIRRAKELGKPEVADQQAHDAARRWPEEKAAFWKLLKA